MASKSPPVNFERAYGVSSIAGHYRFPTIPGMDQVSLGNRIWPDESPTETLTYDDVTRIFAELERLNGEKIGKISFNRKNPEELEDVIRGIVSGFNPDDINLFMKRSHGPIPLQKVLRSKEERKRKEFEIKIMQRLEFPPAIDWIASENTLETIWQQVKDRPIVTSLEEATELVDYKEAARNKRMRWAVGLGLAGIASCAAWRNHETSSTSIPAHHAIVREGETPNHAAEYLKDKSNRSEESTRDR